MIKIDKRLGVVLVLIIVLIVVYKLRNHFKGSKDSSSKKTSKKTSKNSKNSRNSRNSKNSIKSGKSLNSGNSSNTKQPAKPNPPEKKGIMSSLFSFGDSNTKNNKKDNKKENKKESSSSSDSDDGLKEDAQQLYNLIHSDMCNGMTSEEFERRVGDLADNIIYIELVQLYQDHKDAGKNPERTVKSDHYEKVLEKQLS